MLISAFIFQVDEIEKEILRAISDPAFSHSLGHSSPSDGRSAYDRSRAVSGMARSVVPIAAKEGQRTEYPYRI